MSMSFDNLVVYVCADVPLSCVCYINPGYGHMHEKF